MAITPRSCAGSQRGLQLGVLCFLLGLSAADACSCLCAGPNALSVPQCSCCEYKVVAVGEVVSIIGVIGGFGVLDVNVLVTEEVVSIEIVQGGRYV